MEPQPAFGQLTELLTTVSDDNLLCLTRGPASEQVQIRHPPVLTPFFTSLPQPFSNPLPAHSLLSPPQSTHTLSISFQMPVLTNATTDSCASALPAPVLVLVLRRLLLLVALLVTPPFLKFSFSWLLGTARSSSPAVLFLGHFLVLTSQGLSLAPTSTCCHRQPEQMPPVSSCWDHCLRDRPLGKVDSAF